MNHFGHNHDRYGIGARHLVTKFVYYYFTSTLSLTRHIHKTLVFDLKLSTSALPANRLSQGKGGWSTVDEVSAARNVSSEKESNAGNK